MNQHQTPHRFGVPLRLSAVAVLVAAAALSACERRDATPKVDDTSVGAQTEQRLEQMGQDARQGMNDAKEAVREAGQDIANASKEVGRDVAQAGREVGAELKDAGAAVGDKAADALITTKINAEFAKESSLSVTQINVDTYNGKVVLRGHVRDEAAKERALQLAKGVSGVSDVESQLTVDAKP